MKNGDNTPNPYKHLSNKFFFNWKNNKSELSSSKSNLLIKLLELIVENINPVP